MGPTGRARSGVSTMRWAKRRSMASPRISRFTATVLKDPEFIEGGVDTGYLARFLAHAEAEA